MFAPQLQKLGIERACAIVSEVRDATSKGIWRVGVGDFRRRLSIAEFREFAELAPASLPHCLRKPRIGVIGEIEEGLARTDFFAHEDQWNFRCQQLERHCRFEDFWVSKCGETFAKGAVADLVMILKK